MKHEDTAKFDRKRIEAALDYIDNYWITLEKYHPRDDGSLIGLPRPYFVPSNGHASGFSFEEMYYWDSYFTAQAFWGTERERHAQGMLENLLFMMKRYYVIPNAGRTYFTGRSQPPFLTTFIMEVYQRHPNKRWFEACMDVAKEEYRRVWLGTATPHWRQVFHGLSRYYDVNVLHDLAEAESGWDMTTRFDRHCLDFIPIDLNSLLYKYEKDFAVAATILGEPDEAAEWERRAKHRKAVVDKYLWDESKGFYFDYDYQAGKQSKVWSLAGYYPMWAGMVSQEKAKRMMKHLTKFEAEGGLTTTAKFPQMREELPAQWSYPNGWAPLHLLAVRGFEQYGFKAEATRVARKWLATNLAVFENSGVMLEKYNVVNTSEPAKDGVYPQQTGFGWTNAVFVRLCQDYLTKEELPEVVVAPKLSVVSAEAKERLRGLRVHMARQLPRPDGLT